MNFEVGDLVRVKTDLETDVRYGYCWFRATMREFCGKVYKVEEVDTQLKCYKLADVNWYWTDEMLEPVAIVSRELTVRVPFAFKKLFEPALKVSVLPDVVGTFIAKLQSMLDNKNKLIINKPAVILFKDGKKHVVKLSKGDKWDEEKGVAFALLKSFGIDYKKFKKILKAAVRQ